MTTIPIKRALISVCDKHHIVDFAQKLIDLNIEIISTGGTGQILTNSGIDYTPIEAVTGLPEMLNGRVKTLHPKVHGGILGQRDRDIAEAQQLNIQWIDLVVVNFYAFSQAIAQGFETAIEHIDIGGPTMVRAAAKNCAWVGVVVDPNDYTFIASEIERDAGLSLATRKRLAAKAFALTAGYDAKIRDYFASLPTNQQTDAVSQTDAVLSPTEAFVTPTETIVTQTDVVVSQTETVIAQTDAVVPRLDRGIQSNQLNLSLEKHTELRYGENPHQKAYAYRYKQHTSGVLTAHQHQGKPLSYNNILDTEAARACVAEFDAPTCVIVKHANPCGVASAVTIESAYQAAFQADSTAAFGGIVALNRICTEQLVEQLLTAFTEVIIAPAYTKEALLLLSKKPNLRVLEMTKNEETVAWTRSLRPGFNQDSWEIKSISGGLLLQEKDQHRLSVKEVEIVTTTKPSAETLNALLFAWRVIKHVKSNAIVIAKNEVTVGIGAGQVSRIDAVDVAVQKAKDNIAGSVLASDAFFPFRDSIDRIAGTGIIAIIQPGGSVRDEEVIAACNEHGIAMVFTHKRCFKH